MVGRKARKKIMDIRDSNKNLVKARMIYLKYLKVKNQSLKKKYGQLFLKLIRKEAYRGYPSAQFDLGALYDYSNLVKCNYKKAFYWYMKAAEQGYGSALNSVGFCYYHGIYVRKNEKKAVYWYKKAAEAGDPFGIRNLRLSLKAMQKKKSKKLNNKSA